MGQRRGARERAERRHARRAGGVRWAVPREWSGECWLDWAASAGLGWREGEGRTGPALGSWAGLVWGLGWVPFYFFFYFFSSLLIQTKPKLIEFKFKFESNTSTPTIKRDASA